MPERDRDSVRDRLSGELPLDRGELGLDGFQLDYASLGDVLSAEAVREVADYFQLGGAECFGFGSAPEVGGLV